MTFDAFTASVTKGGDPPAGLRPAVTALWLDAAGRWDDAHRAVQDGESPADAWVHAYLHRKEGDVANAGYWYRRAGHPLPTVSLEEEWTIIASTLLTGR